MKTKKIKVLYVDDEEINLRVFKNVFRREFDIFIAKSGQEGLDYLSNNDVEVILTDQRMPNMTGVEFLEQVTKKYPLPLPSRLIVSGYSSPDSIEKAFENYCLSHFVSKPWDKEELKELIINSINKNHD